MTGSGKTAAFVLPLLQRLIPKSRGVTRALILTPTRELAAQINEQIEIFGKFTGLRSATIFGGVPMPAQKRAFESGVDIMVATPGAYWITSSTVTPSCSVSRCWCLTRRIACWTWASCRTSSAS